MMVPGFEINQRTKIKEYTSIQSKNSLHILISFQTIIIYQVKFKLFRPCEWDRNGVNYTWDNCIKKDRDSSV